MQNPQINLSLNKIDVNDILNSKDIKFANEKKSKRPIKINPKILNLKYSYSGLYLKLQNKIV